MDIVSADKLFSKFESSRREESNANDIGIGIKTSSRADETVK